MSQLTEQQVRYVADLANLHLSAEEVARVTRDLSSILGHMDELAKINTDGVEPMAQVLSQTDTLREDVPRQSFPNETALANAPLSGNGYFKVPKVVDK